MTTTPDRGRSSACTGAVIEVRGRPRAQQAVELWFIKASVFALVLLQLADGGGPKIPTLDDPTKPSEMNTSF